MIKDPQITLFDLVICLSDAMDLISSSLVNHHKQVAYIASSLGQELGLDDDKQKDLFLAGALHDIGALSLKERIDTLQFEIKDGKKHAELGGNLLQAFKPLAHLMPTIHSHHACWNDGEGIECNGQEVPIEGHILHLADRTAVLINKEKEILGQVPSICEAIKSQSGKMFRPDMVDAFMSLAQKEYFWLDIVSPTVYRKLRYEKRLRTVLLNINQLNELTMFFSRIIDFRSPFTATHSSGVASCAEALAGFAGFSKRECQMMRIAGYLHDLGKLAVPKEILEKPGKLTREDFNVIRSHTYHTYRILDTLEGFDTITTWGAFHHERLDGSGYPFHHGKDELPLGSRIMCVADIFTAVAEDRPYRKGMQNEEVKKVLRNMVHAKSLDGDMVSLLERNYDSISNARKNAQSATKENYYEFLGDGSLPDRSNIT